MSTKNRGDRIQLLHKVVTKHFTPVSASEDRNVLEHLVYACCLEDAKYEQADEAFHRLRESFFDWNEIRVTTVTELGESLQSLSDPLAAAVRVKQNLQSLFESRYSFEIDDMTKMNQGEALQELEKLKGMTKFVLSYIVQNALGGHSIPVSSSVMQVLLACEIVSEAEAAKGLAPGLERTVAKTKGPAFGSCLHQLAIAHAESPDAKQTKAIMKEAGAVEKKPEPKPKPVKKAAKKKETAEKPAAKKAEPKKAATKKATAPKKAPAKKAPAKKAPAKKAAPQKAAPKKAAPKKAAPKKAAKKPAAKKATSKKSATKKKPR
ncbi:MAG: hypothetical protein VXZ82_11330 [Planctomycetota bacterium]|nr:hypothetical protein [Planctomycetota bacterium]